MNKLLTANFRRLRRDKAFYVTLIVVFLASLVVMLQTAGTFKALAQEGYNRSLDRAFFGMAPFMPAFFAAFIGLFVGTEYSDGTLRNKLIVGRTRSAVFLANFTVCFTATAALIAAWLLGALPGIWLYRPLDMGLSGAAVYILVALGFGASFTALFVGVSMLSTNRALTLIYSIALWLVLLLFAAAVYDRLCEPETNSGMAFINGAFVTQEPTPNPLYLSGRVRAFWQKVLEFNPMGQAILMEGGYIESPVWQLVFSLVFTGLALPIGMALFQRKDLK